MKDLDARTAHIGKTKNGSPLNVHLVAPVVSCLENLERRQRIFGFSKSGRLYSLLGEAERRIRIELPPRSAFHILRHTHATNGVTLEEAQQAKDRAA